MIIKSPIKKSKAYYEAFGYVKWTSGYTDLYRFRRVRRHLLGDSVLDAGCGKADFLNLITDHYQIAGIEINKERVSHCNQVLGQDSVKLGNLELDNKLDFQSDSFDSVVCLEVLEHLVDPESTLKELVRISRKRVIITVPFNQEIRYVLCMHCGKRTPATDHLHSFNKENIIGIIPDDARILKTELIGNTVLSYLPGLTSILRLPIQISSIIDRILSSIVPRASWMMVVLDKK